MRFASLVLAVALFVSGAYGAQPTEKFSPELQQVLDGPPQVPVKIWVYFTDHGEENIAELDAMISRVTFGDRARERRLNRSSGPIADVHDLFVHEPYIHAVRAAGCRIRHASKYLNAVSAFATADQIRAVAAMPFIRRISRVQTSHRDIPPAIQNLDAPLESPDRGQRQMAPVLDYGSSYDQLDQINVIPLHDANVNGQGVLIAMLDTGFNRSHESMIHLDIVAEWDFVNNDPDTKDEPGDPPNQHYHGTYTLSAIGGYAPGELIGPAWAASYAIGKTEQINVEIQQEEDDYVRGLEWADSLGAAIVSTSLGYYDWYSYEDMDGNTAVTTIAADIAAAKGVAVITAAGNEGNKPWHYIIAPSDGDSVIAVGAVDATGVIASFSSYGPSFDLRTKPDLCARGVSVRCASYYDSLGYADVSGTSLATPLVAGAAALCLQMHPYWSPIDLRDALRADADHAGSPDNRYGWGIINAYQTALSGASGIHSKPQSVGTQATLYQNAPNPFNPSTSGGTSIRFQLAGSQPVAANSASPTASDGARDVTIAIYDVSGRLVRRLFDGQKTPGDYTVDWDGRDNRGVAVSSSVYYYRLSVGRFHISKKLVLIRQ